MMNEQFAPSRKAAFTAPETMPGPLDARTSAALLAAVGDLALVLRADGTILDLAVPRGDLADLGLDLALGDAWIDSVTIESRPKITEMLAEAAVAGGAPRWRQVNHATVAGDLPIRYMVMALGRGDRLIAIGRDMRAAAEMQQRLLQTQQSLERDYIRLRQVETRYRMLFDMASDALLIVDAESRRVREANPVAQRLLQAKGGALVGEPVQAIVDPFDRDRFMAHLGAAEASDGVAPLAVRLRDGDREANVSARLFRQSRTALLLVRIVAAVPETAREDHRGGALIDVIERMPDAFVLVDGDLNVVAANAAFVELTGLSSVERVTGTRLGVWLGRPGIDLELIVAQLREHGTVRNVATILRGAADGHEEVEVSGVGASLNDGAYFGFTIRTVARRIRYDPLIGRDLPQSVEQLTELVGRMSLKQIVRQSTDLIERLCIEAALAYTSDNRASAAEVLGVSRQNLYSKLHRHGLGNLVSDDN